MPQGQDNTASKIKKCRRDLVAHRSALVLSCTRVPTARAPPSDGRHFSHQTAQKVDDRLVYFQAQDCSHQQQRPLPQIFVRAEARQPRQQRPLPRDRGSTAPVPRPGGRSGGLQKGTRDRVAKHGRQEAVHGFVETWRGLVENLSPFRVGCCCSIVHRSGSSSSSGQRDGNKANGGSLVYTTAARDRRFPSDGRANGQRTKYQLASRQ